MRLAKCQCKGCNNVGTVEMKLAKRGNRSAFLCEYHANSLQGYTQENGYRQGTEKCNGFTLATELETSFSTMLARTELHSAGFIATSDCTVDVEYKSPIYEGLNSIIKQCDTIQRLIDNNELEINNTCGTHCHVGHREYINPTTMDYIRRFSNSLFTPLSKEIENNPEMAEKVFGRNFNNTNWACPINENTGSMEHKNFINLQHDYTIEFRLCKFVNANQYKNLIRMNKEIANAIINNFVKHFNDTDFDATRYSNQREYRLHKAQVTAKKLVKIYNKYAMNV